MQSTLVVINILGAVALLLFGLAQVKDGVTRAFGARLRTGLANSTKSGLRSILSGLIATIALQSSTATALMTASFAERGLVNPRMAQIVLLGANIGTAVTAWLVAAGTEVFAPLLLLAGVILLRNGSAARKGLGTALIGIGLMLLSLHLLSSATEPMRQSPALAAFIGLLDTAWSVALAFAAGIAFISSSSLAAVVLILSLASTGNLSTARSSLGPCTTARAKAACSPRPADRQPARPARSSAAPTTTHHPARAIARPEIGRASCRERV